MGSDKECVKVLMFPWLAHGHITPFLELAKRLSHRNFHCYICSTPANLTSIANKIPQKYSNSIHLLHLHLASSDQLPPHYHTTNGLPLHLHPALRSALRAAKPDLSNILTTLQPHLLIHDILLRWAGAIASEKNIPSVTFFTSGAAMFSYFCHLGQRGDVEFPYPAIRLTGFELSMAIGALESSKNEEKDPDEDAGWNFGRTIIVNSSREIDGKYMDYLSEMLNREFIPVGSLVRDYDDDDAGEAVLMDWLSQKDKFSCVFVSFGTEYFLKREEIEEVAYGLELSNVNFIWIVRFPKGDGTTVEETLPAGFLERVGGRGRIVEKWASQAKILTHPSVGGFVSHCGWNSLTESIEFGVPIIAMPMHLDQPMNAKLVAELGVGVEVKRDNEGRLQREEIAKVIRDVVVGESGGRGRAEKRWTKLHTSWNKFVGNKDSLSESNCNYQDGVCIDTIYQEKFG
ncbi:UNVERIFIED_CONTAM: Beta-D-glucosyl crocetin beta-1,6-glucosyltransferase [Sesamum radiatum]|uniref:Glycosyltransferase n=1 Tax=Sesamum radiatum TaxID=300843 RepID=A0AAW2NCG3_SESRA